VKPELGVAVRATTVLLAYDAEQVAPHEIPVGTEVIVPLPVTVVVSVNGPVDIVPTKYVLSIVIAPAE
jgi:hypothetical protein